MTMFTKEELRRVLNEVHPKFKHVEPHVILIMYAYYKIKELKKIN